MTDPALRVARRFVASYFKLNDVVLYGKYKNHHGKIVGFDKDKWGNPTIEIEPIPKGRKKNKVMGLFKIWRADVKEKALAELNKQAAGERPKEFYETWAEALDKEAKGLDLKDEEDRITFRLRVHHAMRNLRAEGMRDLALNLDTNGSSRETLPKAIANAYIAGKRIKTATQGRSMDLSKRVAFRFVKAEGIPLGKTFEHGTVRTHRFRGLFRITDLTNAGKRGKKVQEMAVSLGVPSDSDPWYDNTAKMIPHADSYGEILRLFKDLQKEDPRIRIYETELRGVDVNPGGTTEINLTTNEGVEITALPDSFLVKSIQQFESKGKPTFQQDTLYSNVSKKDAAPFYNWLKANLSEANKMDIMGLRKLWDSLGVHYDYH
jgi:hypothetical protein